MVKRVNLTISEVLFEKVEGMAKETGLSYSAICNMALIAYFDQKEALSAMSKLQPLIEQLQALSENVKETNLSINK